MKIMIGCPICILCGNDLSPIAYIDFHFLSDHMVCNRNAPIEHWDQLYSKMVSGHLDQQRHKNYVQWIPNGFSFDHLVCEVSFYPKIDIAVQKQLYEYQYI